MQANVTAQGKEYVESSSTTPTFEWIVSAPQLHSILAQSRLFEETTNASKQRNALHVGCGSSTLGEYLAQVHDYEVANVDVDTEVLVQMLHRWRDMLAQGQKGNMCFVRVDLSTESIPYPSGYFDLVVDKSTLDCLLCTDDATTSLFCETYRSLNPQNGVYVVVSFQPSDFLLPLLRDLPGAEWVVDHQVLLRHAARPANVMICRRSGSTSTELCRDAVRDHVLTTNAVFFQTQCPLSTKTCEKDWQAQLEKSCAGNAFQGLSLEVCYAMIFTDAERTELTYEDFLGDWNAFCERHPEVPSGTITFEVAAAFLQELGS